MEQFMSEDNDFTHDLESTRSKFESNDQFLLAVPIIALYFSIEFGKCQIILSFLNHIC